MARPIRVKLDLTPESVRNVISTLLVRNEELRLCAMRDYREIKQIINNGTPEARVVNAVNLETARNNAQRMAKDALSNTSAAAKLLADYVMHAEKLKAAPAGEGQGDDTNAAVDQRVLMRELAAEMRKNGDI